MSRLVFVLLISAWFLSCRKSSDTNAATYFDLAGTIKTQIALLSNEKPAVTKEVNLSGKKEVKTLNELDWEKELALFVQADINKNAYQKSYSVIDSDSLVTYRLREGESLPVKEMVISFAPSKLPREITVVTVTSNFLLNARRTLRCSFTGGRLSSYAIQSEQKLFIGQPDLISVSGHMQYK